MSSQATSNQTKPRTEGEPESSFTEWWKSHKDTNTVKVNIPYEQHRLVKQSSNHAKQGMMADFLHFVDMNSQPNGQHASSHSAQFFFLPRCTRLDSLKWSVS